VREKVSRRNVGQSTGRNVREIVAAGSYLLRVQSDDKRGNVDHLLADTDVPLPDEDSGVVDGLGETITNIQKTPPPSASSLFPSPSISTRTPDSPALEDLGLQPPLQEIFDLEGQDVIQPHPRVIEHSDSDESSNQGVTLEETLGVLFVELEEFSGSSSDLTRARARARTRRGVG